MEGIVKKVVFNHTKGKAIVSFSNSKTVFDFRNGKKKRADSIKKMNLRTGEHVIVIGAKSEGSSLYVYGWEIKRFGYLCQGKYSLLRGRLIKQEKSTLGEQILHLLCDKKTFVVKSTITSQLKNNCELTALCYSIKDIDCKACNNWKFDTCNLCRKNNNDLTIIESNGGY